MEELKDGYISENGKLVLDFLQAIHAAEKRQADLDAHAFNEEKKVLKVWPIKNHPLKLVV